MRSKNYNWVTRPTAKKANDKDETLCLMVTQVKLMILPMERRSTQQVHHGGR